MSFILTDLYIQCSGESSISSSSSSSSSRFYNAEPQWYEPNSYATLTSIITVRVPGQGYIVEYEYHIWNNRGVIGAGILANGRLGISCSNGLFTGQSLSQGQEVVTEKWISLKSNGAGGSGIIDDAQAEYKACGGPLDDYDNFIYMGDMPTNTYRKIFVKVTVPEGAVTDGVSYPLLVLQYDARNPDWSSSSSSISSSSMSSSSSSISSSSFSSSSMSVSSSSKSISSSSSSKSSYSSSSKSSSSSSSLSFDPSGYWMFDPFDNFNYWDSVNALETATAVIENGRARLTSSGIYWVDIDEGPDGTFPLAFEFTIDIEAVSADVDSYLDFYLYTGTHNVRFRLEPAEDQGYFGSHWFYAPNLIGVEDSWKISFADGLGTLWKNDVEVLAGKTMLSSGTARGTMQIFTYGDIDIYLDNFAIL